MTESGPPDLDTEAALMSLCEAALEGLGDLAAGRLLEEVALDDVLRPGGKPPSGP